MQRDSFLDNIGKRLFYRNSENIVYGPYGSSIGALLGAKHATSYTPPPFPLPLPPTPPTPPIHTRVSKLPSLPATLTLQDRLAPQSILIASFVIKLTKDVSAV